MCSTQTRPTPVFCKVLPPANLAHALAGNTALKPLYLARRCTVVVKALSVSISATVSGEMFGQSDHNVAHVSKEFRHQTFF